MYESEEVECGDCGGVFPLRGYQYHSCNMAEGTQQSSQSTSQIITNTNRKDVNVAILAEAVQARPALWDHTLPLKERGKDIRENMWREVYEEIDGVIPLDTIEKKWKNLKDTFLKHLKTYKPSGGGAEDKKKWKHFDALYFLANVNSSRKTFGNVLPIETDVDFLSPTPSTSSETNVDLLSPPSKKFKTGITNITSKNKRQKKSDETDEILLEILKQPAPARTTPGISPALMAIQEVLNKLPERVRMDAEIEMLNRVYQLYAENS